ncbi:MAG: ATP-dependent Clp protease ATP-binding subunit [Planctomycetes bacterium]|nr:ATP-dependent Clp protease ATP-binding subunit [Planctomycetota bacterium]
MIRMEPNIVLRYCEGIDEFVKVRVFTNEEIAELLHVKKIPSKRSYQQLVVNACIVGYNDLVAPKIAVIESLERRMGAEERVYQVCIEANPNLDISQVALPVPGEERAELHLFDNVPALAAPARDHTRLQGLEGELGRRVIGQEEAIQTVSRVVRKALLGLRNAERPIGTFFFVGQTGVGKTELAKALTQALYDDRSKLIRIDCSEYSMPHEYAKLIGAPPGYIGHKEGGYLTESLRKRGSGVVLFDEIEKADSKVHDLLLQVLDEGTLTDSKGNRVPFNDTVIIMTSNVGVEQVDSYRNRSGFDVGKRQKLEREDLLRETVTALKQEFRPEFINRLDEVVLFDALELDDCLRIVDNLLAEVQTHAERVKLTLEFTGPVRRFLAEKGYSREYGARELRRTVEDQVEGPLSEEILSGHIKEGSAVKVSVRGGRLAFHGN